MTQIVHRVNLSANVFPFLSEHQGRTVIVKGQDQNFVQIITSSTDLDKDVGIPQIYYCHNVLPIDSGFQSIGYDALIPQFSSVETGFNNMMLIRDSSNNKAYMVIQDSGKVYVLLSGAASWVYITTVVVGTKANATTAYVNGVTYVCVANNGVYKFDFTINAFLPVTLTGLTMSSIIGIVACTGYLIAYSIASIAWSSTLDPTDFTPSTITGAGGGSVQGAKGPITYCMQHTVGFMVYTASNAIAVTASGNIRYPFNFRELVSSGGLADASKVAFDAVTGNHYAYTTAGIQMITMLQTNTLLPEATDFLAGSYFEDFDDVLLQFSRTTLTSTMKKQLSMVADRYLVISYGINEYTHALVYDLAMKRFGKLKITHVDCFEYQLLSPEIVETPKKSLAFLQKNGTVQIVNFGFGAASSSGVLLLGKYQYVRSRTLQLDEVILENVPLGFNPIVKDWYTLDGKTQLSDDVTLLDSSGLVRDYGARATGVNHSILIVGNFSLASVVIVFNIHGRR